MNPYSGAGRKARQMMPQSSSTFVREGETESLRKERPFPPKVKRFYAVFSVVALAVAGLPLFLEASDIPVQIGPWWGLLITLPLTLITMIVLAFLRDGLPVTLIFGAMALFGFTLAYSLEFDPDHVEKAMLWRGGGLAVMAALLLLVWRTLKTGLRDWHYRVASGESWQDIMLQYQQAAVIKKAGGTPVLDEKGRVVDRDELMPRPGFRPKKSRHTAGSLTDNDSKKKKKKPKLR